MIRQRGQATGWQALGTCKNLAVYAVEIDSAQLGMAFLEALQFNRCRLEINFPVSVANFPTQIPQRTIDAAQIGVERLFAHFREDGELVGLPVELRAPRHPGKRRAE